MKRTQKEVNNLEEISSKIEPRFDRPIIIVAAPRSGSTLLFETLQQSQTLWSIGDESHRVFESIPALHPASRQFESNALGPSDLSATVAERVLLGFTRGLKCFNGEQYQAAPNIKEVPTIRFLEKTPKNALRIPFIKALFPDALFVFLHRQARPNIASMIDAWNSGHFVTYPRLPDWPGRPWSLLLPERWQSFKGRPLAEVAAWQWAFTNHTLLKDLSELPEREVHRLSYEEFINNKHAEIERICAFADIPFDSNLKGVADAGLPNSKYTLSQPSADKWKQHEAALERAIDSIPLVRDVERHLLE